MPLPKQLVEEAVLDQTDKTDRKSEQTDEEMMLPLEFGVIPIIPPRTH